MTGESTDLRRQISGPLELVAEEAAVFGRMPFRECDVVGVVTFFAELLGGFPPLVTGDVIKLAVRIVVGDPAGRFRRCLPEEGQDDDGDAEQDQVSFFQGECHSCLVFDCVVAIIPTRLK